MLLVGLTGGIASGKSVVASAFARKGAYVHRADEEAHGLMAPGRPAWKRIVARFGKEILRPDRTIDRKVLGAIVFRDAAARRDLEGIVHPLVIRAMKKTASRLAREGRHALFVSEAALIFEAGLEKAFDRIVVAYCPADLQLRRLMERDAIGPEEARRRLSAQMSPDEKRARADYVIDTSGAFEDTLARTEAVWSFLMEEARRKSRRGSQ